MKLVVGLGNPGEKYEYTRHNAGFLVLNAFVAKKGGDGVVWLDETRFQSHIFHLGDTIFAKPQTFMNESGEAVTKLLHYYKIELNDLLVVHDDVDLEFGKYKLKQSESSAGHHGVEDIISRVGSEHFWRLRLGVGRPADKRFNVEDYVLQKFSDDELDELKALFESDLYSKVSTFISSD